MSDPAHYDASWRLKLDRAQEHLRDFQDELWRYIDREPYEALLRQESKAKPGRLRAYLRVTEQPPARLAILAGDAIHNTRSSLDHLAASIVPSKRRSKAFFPIVGVPRPGKIRGEPTPRERQDLETWERFDSATKGMPEEAVTAITDLQPFNHGPAAAQGHVLSVINRLDNADKHRQLLVMVPGLTNANTQIGTSEMSVGTHRFAQFVQDGAILTGTSWLDGTKPPELEVHVKVSGRIEVALEVRGTGEHIAVTSMESFVGYIRKTVLPELEPFAKP